MNLAQIILSNGQTLETRAILPVAITKASIPYNILFLQNTGIIANMHDQKRDQSIYKIYFFYNLHFHLRYEFIQISYTYENSKII